MIHTHQSSAFAILDRQVRDLHVDSARRLHLRNAGWIQVEAGMVWLTRDGGGIDHVLSPGERLWLGRGEGAVIEPWQRDQAASLRWGGAERAAQAVQVAQAGRGLGLALAGGLARGLAGALRGAAGRLLLAARKAEAMANRAQGSMRAGDSMASSGAVK